MPTISPQELSAKLQAKLQADQQAVDDLTRTQLEKHAESLEKLSSDALTTTENAIQHHNRALDQLHQSSLQRLRWMLVWPVLASLCLALLILISASAWSWWTVKQSQQEVMNYQATIEQMTEQFCKSPAGLLRCKK